MMAPETVVTVDPNKPSPQQAPPPQQQGGPLDWIKINIDYFKAPPGLLKIVQLVSLIWFIKKIDALLYHIPNFPSIKYVFY